MATKGSGPAFELSVDQQAVQKVAKALRAESDGKTLRKELMAELKTAVAPGVAAVQGKLRAIPHRSAAPPARRRWAPTWRRGSSRRCACPAGRPA
jgi:hypothetical protein